MKTNRVAAFSLAALLSLASSQAFAADLTTVQQAAIRQEVLQAMHGMLAAEERLDAAAVWAYHADVPDYLWADIDGQLYDFAGTKKNWADYYAGCAKLKFITKREEVMVLGPDLAFYLWHGSAEVTGKDGAVSRGDPWTARYLLRRIGGAWKMVGGQESSSPAQPVTPPVSTVAPAPSDTSHAILSMLDDYFAAVNARDPAKFLGFFAPNEDLTVFEDKELRPSRREFAAFVDGFFKDVSQIQASWEQRTVHELAPNAAVVTGTFKVEAKDAKGAPIAFRNAFTFVLVKPADRWLVKHVHESSLLPP
jgi:uncharacterized protein (TIGR02246 family)